MEDDVDDSIFECVDIVTDVNLALSSALTGNRRGRVGTTKRDHLVEVVNEYAEENDN